MNTDGTNQHLLLAEDNYNDERPSFSPDGSLIVFSRCTLDFETCALYQIEVDGSGLKALTNLELGIRDVSPDYSPDGKSIVFFSTDRDGILGALYVHSGNVSSLARLTPAELSARLPDWSPEGQRIAFSTHCCNPQNEEIWTVSRTGHELARLTKNGNDYFAGPHDLFPSWSPEGDAIVFERDAPDFSSSAIVVMKPDGSEPRKMLALPRSSRSAALSRKFKSMGSQAQKRRLKQIEEGGALPRWGVAPN
jgi:TolB protein